MLRIVLPALAALLALLSAPAAAQRHVLLDICNETGFSVAAAAAAAYQTTPNPSRTLRTWFLIAPHSCLDGALDGVVGGEVDLHVMSGEWRWPAGSGDTRWCVPASGSTLLATTPDCPSSQQARSFRRTPVTQSNRRGPGGAFMGQVSWRIRCQDLAQADAHLCVDAPADNRGMARSVRTLEVCNSTRRDQDMAAFETRPDGNLALLGRAMIEPAQCVELFRAFPADDAVMLAAFNNPLHGDGAICLPAAPFDISPDEGGTCAAGEAVAGIQALSFGEYTARLTSYVAR